MMKWSIMGDLGATRSTVIVGEHGGASEFRIRLHNRARELVGVLDDTETYTVSLPSMDCYGTGLWGTSMMRDKQQG